MELTGAQMICECLVREGVEYIFGLPGGSTLPFYDMLPQYPQLKHILVRHEQVAAHAAAGWARVTGEPGVAVVTAGPGVTDSVSGVAEAFTAGCPMIEFGGRTHLRDFEKGGAAGYRPVAAHGAHHQMGESRL